MAGPGALGYVLTMHETFSSPARMGFALLVLVLAGLWSTPAFSATALPGRAAARAAGPTARVSSNRTSSPSVNPSSNPTPTGAPAKGADQAGATGAATGMATGMASGIASGLTPVLPPGMAPGMVSLTFDNALAGVYNNAYPVLKAHHLAATVGVAPGKLDPANDDFMTLDELHEVAAHGWEIASNGVHHKRATDIPRLYSDEAKLSWRLDDPANHVFQTTYEYAHIACVLENGDPLTPANDLEAMLATPGSYFFDRTIEELHVRPRSNSLDPAEVKLSVCSHERELAESRDILGRLGFPARVFVAPFNTWSPELKALAGKYYPLAAAAFSTPLTKETFDPLWISRVVVREQDTAASIIRLLRVSALENREWVVLAFRNIGRPMGREPWSTEKFRKVADWLAENKVRTVTLSQGAALMAAQVPAAHAPANQTMANQTAANQTVPVQAPANQTMGNQTAPLPPPPAAN